MCGIAGLVDLEGGPIDVRTLLAMNEAIAHRGPDDEGFVLVGEDGQMRSFAGTASSPAMQERLGRLNAPLTQHASIGLAHRRFSIIELSDAGHQPFVDREGVGALAFNGEIYNYLELRVELEASGARFLTDSDTEVVMEAYKHWGTRCFERFNGFWAIALYDARTKSVLLSRDRIGKKPLFFTRVGSLVCFASEIKSLLAVDAVRARASVNEDAVSRFLLYGRRDLDQSTCFSAITALPAASWTMIDDRFPARTVAYWRLPAERMREREISTTEAARQVRETLTDAVRLRLRADVPVGVELSGGMDSSTLVALAALESPRGLATYTIRFPPPHDEEPFARMVAERHKTQQRVLDPPPISFWGGVRAFTALEEEPYHSPNLRSNQWTWAEMRRLGTKVSLNGGAGDELFGGYAHHYGPAQIENLARGRGRAFLRNAAGHSESATRGTAYVAPAKSLAKTAFRQFAPRRVLARRRVPSFVTGLPYVDDPAAATTLSGVLSAEMTNTQMPYWMSAGDRGYMGVPVEVRAPFLDYRVVELAYRLPSSYLVRDGWHKWILRKATEDILPTEVVWRRHKMGFPFPMSTFTTSSRDYLDLLFESASNPYIDLTDRAAITEDFRALSFLLWYELFFNRNEALFDDLERMSAERGQVATGFTPRYLRTCARP